MKKVLSCAFLLLALLLANATIGAAEEPAKLYAQNCAMCHETAASRAPARDTLRQMQANHVLDVLERGSMVTMANRWTPADRRAIAEWLTDKPLSEPLVLTPPAKAMCTSGKTFSNPSGGPAWNGWGNDGANTRFQPAAGFSASDVPRLKLKWAFGFPGDLSANGQPVIAGGRVFVGSASGLVYALSAATGCVHWYFQAAATVRGAPSIGRVKTASGTKDVVFVGDLAANVYALDAATGAVIWKTKADEHRLARITGSTVFYNGRLFVPVASGEEIASVSQDYECCTFRGSLQALNAATGAVVWKTYTISEPRPTKKNKSGTQMWGPSGTPIWTAPTIDPLRNIVYVTTGDNYSDPTTGNSDAFMAFDRDTGKILWTSQITANDAYTSSCRMPDKVNCPEANGPDVDFASSAILVSLGGGKRVLVAGQKSGVVFAVDPDHGGARLWETRIGKGGTIGGVQWGSAADKTNVYVALSDAGRISLSYTASSDIDSKAGGGMFALRLSDGQRVWYTPAPECGSRPRCSPAQSAAVSAIPGIAFSGSIDGFLRAYSAKDGKVLWAYDTIHDYTAVNGVTTRGGSLDGPGPAIAGGMVIVNSGYSGSGGMPGNALLVFSVDGK